MNGTAGVSSVTKPISSVIIDVLDNTSLMFTSVVSHLSVEGSKIPCSLSLFWISTILQVSGVYIITFSGTVSEVIGDVAMTDCALASFSRKKCSRICSCDEFSTLSYSDFPRFNCCN